MNPHGKIITIFHNQILFHHQEDVEHNFIIVFTFVLYVFIILLPLILIFNFLPCFGTHLNHYKFNYNFLFALNFDVLHIFIKFIILVLDQEKEFLENSYKIWSILDHNIYDHNVQMRRTLLKTLF
jgi:hypothetical protein